MRRRFGAIGLGLLGLGIAYLASYPLVVFALSLAGSHGRGPTAESLMHTVYLPLAHAVDGYSSASDDESYGRFVQRAEALGWELHCRAATLERAPPGSPSALTSRGAELAGHCMPYWTCAPPGPATP